MCRSVCLFLQYVRIGALLYAVYTIIFICFQLITQEKTQDVSNVSNSLIQTTGPFIGLESSIYGSYERLLIWDAIEKTIFILKRYKFKVKM